jgi:hypothetical protein
VSESSNLYRLRKKRLFGTPPGTSFPIGNLAYSYRPHRTLPELVEIYPDLWIPPEPSSSSVGICSEWDSGCIWDEDFYFD